MIAPRTSATPARGAIVVFTLLLALAAPEAATAQVASGAPVATAQILPPPVTGNGVQGLEFGTVALGETVDVPPGAAAPGATVASAGWMFTDIRKGRTISLTLALPPALQRGAHSMPVSWNNPGYGSVCLSNGGGCLWSASFNPGATPTQSWWLANNLSGNNFDLTVYVGARLVVPAGLPPGLYTASVTATFAYVS
jgi:hypothetical protein